MSDKLQQEDTVSADRKVRIIIDPKTGKRKKTSAVMSRQNFDAEKFGNRNKVDDEDQQVKESAIQPTGTSQIDVGSTDHATDRPKDSVKKKESGNIKFVTGNQEVTSSTAIGNAQNMGIKKISEALVKKAIKQIKVDKNVGTEEIPFDGPYTKSSADVVDKSGAHHSPSSRARHLARQAMMKQSMKEELKGDQHKLDKNKNGKLDKQDFKLLRKEESELEEGIQQTMRKYVPGYAKKQIDKKMDAGKFGKTDADKDANFYRYKKVQDKLKKPVKEEVELEEGVTGAVAGAVLGGITAGPAGAVAGGYLGHKTQQGANASKAAKKKIVKEEETTMSKTYAEFIEQLNEYNAKEGVYRHKGTYGGSYDSNDDHDDDEPKKPAAPAVKRGRGRPAGSKSGANQKVTSGKSYGGIATHSLHLPNSK